MIFGASSLYLVLKVGLTVSASIPVGRSFSLALSGCGRRWRARRDHPRKQHRPDRRSAGESVGVWVGVTMPGDMILGFDLEIARVMLVDYWEHCWAF